MNMSVLERQRARWKWEQEDDLYLAVLNGVFSTQTQGLFPSEMASGDSVLSEAMIDTSMRPDPGLDFGWPDFGRVEFPPSGFYGNGSGNDLSFGLSRTLSCPPAVAEPALSLKRSEAVSSEKMSSTGFKKRKADSLQNTKTVVKDESKTKKGCGGAEGDSKITKENASNSNSKSCNKKEITNGASKGSSEVQKPDFIHVRARRGQATDSHSLAERVRRKKISERMKFLQDLVPGCNKITGKAGMLDEIINYVQHLQQQVEFLSMKLAAVNSRLDFDTDSFLTKETFPPSSANFQTRLENPAYPQFNQVQQSVSRSEAEVGVRPPDTGLRRSPIAFPDAFLEPSCFAIQASASWDAELQNTYSMVYDQGRSTPSPSIPFTGLHEASNLKTEM